MGFEAVHGRAGRVRRALAAAAALATVFPGVLLAG
jgi:hypothetical protein